MRRYGVQGGLRIARALLVEGLLTGHIELGNDCTTVALPGSGTDVWVSYRGVSTYPYFSAAIQLVFEPGTPSRLLHPRLIGGGGWMVGSRNPFLTAGAGLNIGRGRTRLVLDALGRWFSANYDIVQETVQWDCTRHCQPTVIGSQSTAAEVMESGLVVRLGLRREIG
jgi:hypothetical protein